MTKELQRRRELTAATLREIGEKGTLNVTVSQIARRAGVSSGLAFHYFGDKEQLFLAAMRTILRDFGAAIRAALKTCETPRERLEAILRQCFDAMHFEDGAVAAWLNFYVLAQTSPEAQRLLKLYHRRLHSNLVHALRPEIGHGADAAAERIAGLIDGLYLRFALDRSAVDPAPAVAHVLAALDAELGTGTPDLSP